MKHFLFLLLIGACCAGTVPGASAQTVIVGKVKLPPARSPEVISKRYEMNGEPGLIEPDPPMAVVYLEGNFPKTEPAKEPVAQMPQKDMQFLYSLIAVRAGSKVEFPNQDDTYHNIFSYSKPKRFDLGRYRKDEHPVPSQTFEKPGVVVLHCDIHEHMRAIVLVLETPHFQRTDTDGKYRLENLPTGHYKLKAWLSNKTTFEQEVDLKPGMTLRVDFP